MSSWLDQIKWNEDGLIPAVAQDVASGRILMQAWVNRDSLAVAAKEGIAVYWSRSRQALWRKGESSGHSQELVDILLDCDADSLIYRVRQQGGIACHTGRESCFYRRLNGQEWQVVDPVLKSPDQIYQQ